MPQIIKTTITLTVFHAAETAADARRLEGMSLADIGYFIDEGDGIGQSVVASIEEIAPAEVEAELVKIGNDGTFLAQDVADIYFPPHLRSDDESGQKWTVKVDQEADTLFRTLDEAEIRRRQAICEAQAKSAFDQQNERASIDIARQADALMREMLRRC